MTNSWVLTIHSPLKVQFNLDKFNTKIHISKNKKKIVPVTWVSALTCSIKLKNFAVLFINWIPAHCWRQRLGRCFRVCWTPLKNCIIFYKKLKSFANIYYNIIIFSPPISHYSTPYLSFLLFCLFTSPFSSSFSEYLQSFFPIFLPLQYLIQFLLFSLVLYQTSRNFNL